MWYLIAQIVYIQTGVPCETLVTFRALPLSCPSLLWEARTRSAWQVEFEVYNSMPRMDLDVFGDLVDACKQRDMGLNRRKMDS